MMLENKNKIRGFTLLNEPTGLEAPEVNQVMKKTASKKRVGRPRVKRKRSSGKIRLAGKRKQQKKKVIIPLKKRHFKKKK